MLMKQKSIYKATLKEKLPNTYNDSTLNKQTEDVENIYSIESGNPNLTNKPSKKKSLIRSNSNNKLNTGNSSQIKRTHLHKYPISNLIRFFVKRNAELKEVKISELQMILRMFFTYSTNAILPFNELILALKNLGIQIQTERKFQMVNNIYSQICVPETTGVDAELFLKLAVKMLKDERNNPNSHYCIIEKGYYYMVEEGNNVTYQTETTDKNNQNRNYLNYKRLIEQLPADEKYITSETLGALVKYLGLQKQFSEQEISNIIKTMDRQQKGYLTMEDLIRGIEEIRMFH